MPGIQALCYTGLHLLNDVCEPGWYCILSKSSFFCLDLSAILIVVVVRKMVQLRVDCCAGAPGRNSELRASHVKLVI